MRSAALARCSRWTWLQLCESDREEVSGEVEASVTVTNTGLSGDLVMEPGPVELSLGSSSSDIRSSATLSVTGKARVIDGEHRAFLSVASID